MFSKTCEYGIRAVIYLSSENKVGRKVSLQEICEAIEAPSHYTAKILQTLSRNRIINSQKGVHGGFFLDRFQSDLKLIDIVEAIDGKALFTGCGLGLKQCSDEDPCPIHDKFKGVRNDLKKMLQETTIEDLGKQLKTGKSILKSPDK